MKFLKYSFLTLIGLVVLLSLLPFLFDLNDYKDKITQEVSNRIGRDVSIEGDIRIALFPAPAVTIEGLQIGNPQGFVKTPFLKAGNISVHVALSPLMQREVVVQSVHVENTQAHLIKDKSGKGNWAFELHNDNRGNPEKAASDSAAEDGPSGTPIKDIRLEDIILKDVTVVFEDMAKGKTQTAQIETLNVRPETLRGPFALDGILNHGNISIELSGSIAALPESNAPYVADMNINALGLQLETRTSALIAPSLNVTTSVKGKAASVSTPLKALGRVIDLPPALDGPLRFDTTVHIDETTANIDLRSLTAGSLQSHGRVAWPLKEGERFDVDLATNTLYVGSLMPKGGSRKSDSGFEFKAPSNSGETTPKTGPLFNKIAKLFPLPLPRLNGHVKIRPDAVIYNDQSLRGADGKPISLSVNLTPDTIVIDPLVLSLPYQGRAHIRARARANQLEGSFDVSLPQAQQTLQAFGVTASLPTLSLKGGLFVSPETLRLSDLSGNVNGQSLNGRLSLMPNDALNLDISTRLKDGKPVKLAGTVLGLPKAPQYDLNIIYDGQPLSVKGDADLQSKPVYITADITAETLTFAPKSKSSGGGSSSTTQGGGMKASSGGKGWSREPIDLSALHSLNGSLNLNIGQIHSGDLHMKTLSSKLILKDGVADLQNLSGSIFDGQFTARASLSADKNGNGGNGSMSMDIKDARFEKLFQAASKKILATGRLNADTQLKFAGASMHDIMGSVNGPAQFNVTDGVLNGIDLDNMNLSLKGLNSAEDLIRLRQQFQAGGQTPFTLFSGTFTGDKGVMRSRDIAVAMKKGRIDATADIGLQAQTVAAEAKLTVSGEDQFPGVPIRISGPWSAPKTSFQLNFLEDMLKARFGQKIEEKVQEKLGSALQKLIGGEPQPAPTPKQPSAAPDSPSQDAGKAAAPAPTLAPTPSPEQAVEGLIRGLFSQ